MTDVQNPLADVLRKLSEARRQTAEIQRDWRAGQKAKYVAKWHGSRTAAGISNVTPEAVAEIYRSTDSCSYCGKPLDYLTTTLDHVQPISKDGPHDLANIKPACRHCNTSKHNRTDWVAPLLRAQPQL